LIPFFKPLLAAATLIFALTLGIRARRHDWQPRDWGRWLLRLGIAGAGLLSAWALLALGSRSAAAGTPPTPLFPLALWGLAGIYAIGQVVTFGLEPFSRELHAQARWRVEPVTWLFAVAAGLALLIYTAGRASPPLPTDRVAVAAVGAFGLWLGLAHPKWLRELNDTVPGRMGPKGNRLLITLLGGCLLYLALFSNHPPRL
jgi:hypothetical protein